MMGTMASPVFSGKGMNDSHTKEESEQLLQDLIMEMSDKDYDSIKFASYRTASKLLFIQKKANLHLVDVYNMIEAFRENGLNTLDHNTELHESRLEAIVSSIFYALNKRLPTTHNVDVERCISTVTNWLLYAYDSDAIGRIRVLSVKTALSTLCAGRLVDKLRYHFSQVEDDNGLLNYPKFEAYLRELLQLPAAVGEGPTFGFAEEVLGMFFQPNGPLKRQQTARINFLECVMSKDAPPCYVWLTTMQKIVNALKSQHLITCDVCSRKPLIGLRYKCLHCYNYTLCQDCFWRGKTSSKHKVAHDVREYTSWNTGERGSSFRSKFMCAGGRKKKKSLPDFLDDPEPNKTLDVTNIVPPLPSDAQVRSTSSSDYVSLTPNSASVTSSSPTKFLDDSDSRMDDEHKLISRYAARLAANARQKSPSVSASQSSIDVNREQRELMQTLENKNRLLLKEIRRLREEHEQATKSVAQISQNPQLLAELKLLRQRKDELELRMSALQESRRELMVQLEGLMNLLKNGPPRSPRSPKSQRIADISAGELFSKPLASPPLNGATGDPQQLRGVDGDIKQAFGKQAVSKNLRDDLLVAADNVTNAMFSLVKELNTDIPANQELAFCNGNSDTADLEALERQVNQIRKSLAADEEMGQGHVNGDVTIPDVSTKVISHGREKKTPSGKLGLGRNRGPDGERTDTDTDDDEMLVRNGNYHYKFPARTPMTDDESYIQTDDDEGTARTDNEDQEWQDSMRRWANR